jgi:hypothetical protein
MKELIAGRVALVTPSIVGKLAATCAVIGIVFVSLHSRFIKISRDPAAAEKSGMSIRGWDFLFYMLFGCLITQCVSVLGVLPVFAYLVIPAVSAAFLFSSVKARLLFGGGFAGIISLVGLDTARTTGLDPGPTIVCLFAIALVLLGVFLYLRERRGDSKAVIRVVGFAVLFATFLGGTLLFKKKAATDELKTAVEFARTGDATKARQAMESFKKFPNAKPRWVPLVIKMLEAPDRVVRDAAVTLLGEIRAPEAVAPLSARLAPGVEAEDDVRENLSRALRSIGDARAVPALADAATRDPEADIAVEMAVAAFEIAGPGEEVDLRKAGDVLAGVMVDDGAPGAARRDAGDALRAHVALCPECSEAAAAASWWKEHRDAMTWEAAAHRFVLPAAPQP